MRELKFKDDSAAQERLARAQGAIDDYSAAHPEELSEKSTRNLGVSCMKELTHYQELLE